MESSKSILTKLFTEYYLGGNQAKKDGKPIAYITAFTPVEILRAMDIVCMYPESYAVVCSASGKAQEMIHSSSLGHFAEDLCSYSLIGLGAAEYPKLPYGGIPEPDLLIATNNQCGTLLLWFQWLAQKKKIPLFMIDYPAPDDTADNAQAYIIKQYTSLIEFITEHTGHSLNREVLSEQIGHSQKTCDLWERIHDLNKKSPLRVSVTNLVNALFPIVVAKGTKSACDYYQALLDEYAQLQELATGGALRLLWHGYPMWFLGKKFPRGFDDEFQIVLNDYTLWWNLDYGGFSDPMRSLARAYSSTYLNRPLEQKVNWIRSLASEYTVDGVICHANRSCRRALADIAPVRKMLSQMNIPSVIIESDMANPAFYSNEQVMLRIESFKEVLAAGRPK